MDMSNPTTKHFTAAVSGIEADEKLSILNKLEALARTTTAHTGFQR